MKSPLPVGTPINMRRYKRWLSDFTSYRHQITEERLQRWIDQFSVKDRDLAARVLDCVDFINHEQMSAGFRMLLSGIDGWSPDATVRRGTWRFVAYSSSAGESGDEMLHKFRVANNLASKKFNELFIYKSDLMRAKLGLKDTVVFVDDFSGTGKQICESWLELQELLPGEPRAFLFLVAASEKAIKRVNNETGISCIPHFTMKDRDNIFSERCSFFNSSDRDNLLKYCLKADKKQPKGFGDCGYVVVFSHSCPNNTIPVLHASHGKWEGLFRRYD